MRLRPGDVVRVAKGRSRGPVAVVASAHRKGGLTARLTTISTRGDQLLLTADDFVDTPVSVGSLDLPATFAPNRAEYRRDVARRLGRARLANERRRGYEPLDVATTDGIEADPDLRARSRRRPGRAGGARDRRAGPPGRPPQPVARPRVRPRHRVARGPRLRRRRPRPRRSTRPRRTGMAVDRGGAGPLPCFPRIGPARRRVPAPRAARRHRAGGAGRPGVDVRLRAPQPGSGARTVVPVRRAPPPLVAHRGDERGPRRRRAGRRPRRAPPARRRLRRRGLRLGRGGGLRRGRRRRGGHRRRLRPHHQAAHRPDPPAGPRRTRRGDADAARSAAERAFRGVVADAAVAAAS